MLNLALHVVGHVVEHGGVGGADGVLSEDGEKFVAGIGGWGEARCTQGAEDLRSAVVLGGDYLLEVGRTVVEFVAVEVVDLHALCARAVEGFVHERMAVFVAITAHTRITRPFCCSLF